MEYYFIYRNTIYDPFYLEERNYYPIGIAYPLVDLDSFSRQSFIPNSNDMAHSSLPFQIDGNIR